MSPLPRGLPTPAPEVVPRGGGGNGNSLQMKRWQDWKTMINRRALAFYWIPKLALEEIFDFKYSSGGEMRENMRVLNAALF